MGGGHTLSFKWMKIRLLVARGMCLRMNLAVLSGIRMYQFIVKCSFHCVEEWSIDWKSGWQLSDKAITEIENFFDWIVTLRVETEVPAKKKVTSLPGAIAPIKMDILTPNKVWNMATDLLLTSGMVNLMGPSSPPNEAKSSLIRKGVKTAGIWKNMISHPNYGTYECNFWHVYTIFTCAYNNL